MELALVFSGFILKKAKSRGYPTETITDADYTDDLVLLTNTPVQAKSLLHSLEQAVRSISLYVNSDKTEFKYFNGAISSLNAKPLKFEDQFSYSRSNISSTESNVNICIGKAWTATNR